MEKRPPFPLPSLLPAAANGDGQHQQDDPALLESSLLLLLSASNLAANASAIAAGPGLLPLPPVHALPLRMRFQPQQQQQQHVSPPPPLLPLMFVPPPLPPPQPIRRKRILPRIVAPVAAAEVVIGTVRSDEKPPPVPMPVRRLHSSVVATASPALVSAGGGAVVTVAVADTTASSSPVQSSSNSPSTLLDANIPESSSTATAAAKAGASPSSSTTNEEKPPKKKRIRVKTDRRREQCRANQARYRNKQRGEVVVLEERVEQLRTQVGSLERQRQLQQYRGADASEEVPMQIVMEYFRLFHHGLSFEATDEAAARSSRSQQIAFLQSTMAPDFQFGDSRGVDMFIEQWRRYSRFHGDLTFELESAFSVEKIAVLANNRASYSIHATASLMLTITQESIHHVFPHVNLLFELKTKLLGKRVRYPCSLVFEFDEFDKVQALVCSMDYVASLQELVGNVHELAVLLENARIRHDFFLLDEGEELQQ